MSMKDNLKKIKVSLGSTGPWRRSYLSCVRGYMQREQGRRYVRVMSRLGLTVKKLVSCVVYQ